MVRFKCEGDGLVTRGAPGLISVYYHLIFDKEEAKATSEGHKTQFIRSVREQPDECWRLFTHAGKHTRRAVDGDVGWDTEVKCPYGELGDVVYAKEQWRGYDLIGERFLCEYRSDGAVEEHDANMVMIGKRTRSLQRASRLYPQWMLAAYMPRYVARTWLRIVNARVMQVQDLKREDAIAEGCPEDIAVLNSGDGALWWLREFWDHRHLKRGLSWRANPWAWVIDYELAESPGWW